ncbi:alpha/beta hydrolase fold protein [Xylaria cf. heliscus]|nr:alpha/beta hydrolase fold protein [Xylaria cf. heliscus]
MQRCFMPITHTIRVACYATNNDNQVGYLMAQYPPLICREYSCGILQGLDKPSVMAMTDTPFAQDIQPQLHIFSRLYRGTSIVTAQSLAMGMKWARWWYQWFYPPSLKPNFVKVYECRPELPIRYVLAAQLMRASDKEVSSFLLTTPIDYCSIFFPRDYDQTLPQALPTFFIIHGGGFCMGGPEDDDVWSERFATMHNLLVVELNYRKAPAHPFPTAIYDIEALMLAVLHDESLPLDKGRIAAGGFFAGGNLALSVCQLTSIHEQVKPAAVVAIYPLVDQTIHTKEKLKMRYYKPDVKRSTRGKSSDLLAGWCQTFRWSCIPIGHDLRDPLLSPYFALRDDFPPHIFLIGAELDHLSHEAWRMANKLAGRAVPSFTEMAGHERPARDSESLILDDERFAFEQVDVNGRKSVRWLLVPDEAYGFDHFSASFFVSEEAARAAHLKTVAYQKLMGQWLHNRAWIVSLGSVGRVGEDVPPTGTDFGGSSSQQLADYT